MSMTRYNLLLTAASFGKILLLSSFRHILRHRPITNNKLIILGNGPSLNTSIEKYGHLFGDYSLMCVNNMVLTDKFTELRPAYYVLHAFAYYRPDDRLIESQRKMKKEILDAIVRKTNWDMEILVPFGARKNPEFTRIIGSNKHLKLVYYNQTPIEGYTSVSTALFSMGLGMPRPHNVLIPCITCAVLMKFKEIYILGADHSWLKEITVNEKNEALVNQKHFYDENESKPLVMQDWARPRLLHEMIYKFYLSFRGYWELKPFIEKNGSKVYNASEVSMIDAFERKYVPSNIAKQ